MKSYRSKQEQLKERTDAAKYLRKAVEVPSWLKNRLDEKIAGETCGKVKYGHQETAERAASAMHRKHGGDRMESYYCEQCEAWHIGHSNAVYILITRSEGDG